MRSSPSNADPLDPGPAGFAHRGLHGQPIGPENSLAAFAAAVGRDAGIECDVRLSADGSAVVFHDSNLNRMCGIDLEVERTPSASLIAHSLSGSDQLVPTLSQVLELMDERVPLLIELKTRGGNAASLCRAVRSDLMRSQGPVAAMSFDPRVGRWFARHAPDVRRGLVVRHDLPTVRRWFALLIARPQFLAVDRLALGRSWVERVRRRMPVYSWTIRTPEQRAQAAVHADALIWEADGGPRS